MRRPAVLLCMLALFMLLVPGANASPSDPPNHVTASWTTGGVLVDWRQSTVPADPMIAGYEVMRGPLAAAFGQASYAPLSMVPPSIQTFLDTTAARGQSYAYCVATVLVTGEVGPCSDPGIVIDVGDCLYITGNMPLDPAKVSITGDLQCLWTTDPHIPWPYPYCSPLGFIISPALQEPEIRTGCLLPLPTPPGW